MARPTKITPATVRKLERAFEDGLSVSEACFLSGISRDTYYRHMESGKRFSDKMRRSQTALISKARAVVAKEIKRGDLKTAKWFIERENEKALRDQNELRQHGESIKKEEIDTASAEEALERLKRGLLINSKPIRQTSGTSIT